MASKQQKKQQNGGRVKQQPPKKASSVLKVKFGIGYVQVGQTDNKCLGVSYHEPAGMVKTEDYEALPGQCLTVSVMPEVYQELCKQHHYRADHQPKEIEFVVSRDKNDENINQFLIAVVNSLSLNWSLLDGVVPDDGTACIPWSCNIDGVLPKTNIDSLSKLPFMRSVIATVEGNKTRLQLVVEVNIDLLRYHFKGGQNPVRTFSAGVVKPGQKYEAGAFEKSLEDHIASIVRRYLKVIPEGTSDVLKTLVFTYIPGPVNFNANGLRESVGEAKFNKLKPHFEKYQKLVPAPNTKLPKGSKPTLAQTMACLFYTQNEAEQLRKEGTKVMPGQVKIKVKKILINLSNDTKVWPVVKDRITGDEQPYRLNNLLRKLSAIFRGLSNKPINLKDTGIGIEIAVKNVENFSDAITKLIELQNANGFLKFSNEGRDYGLDYEPFEDEEDEVKDYDDVETKTDDLKQNTDEAISYSEYANSEDENLDDYEEEAQTGLAVEPDNSEDIAAAKLAAQAFIVGSQQSQ